jgi:hypothetical protein
MVDPDFTCPRCSARYKVVRMPPEPPVTELRAIHCVICRNELASNEDGNILKYFLVGGARRRSRERDWSLVADRAHPSPGRVSLFSWRPRRCSTRLC